MANSGEAAQLNLNSDDEERSEAGGAPGVPALLAVNANTDRLHRVTLINKIPVNHDTRIYRFALPSPHQLLGVPVGQHVGLSTRINGEEVLRWYTPLSSEQDRGVVELLIKVYFPCPEFPEGGRLTQFIERMREGDVIDMRGPRGKLTYLGRGEFAVKDDKASEPRNVHVDKVNMVAGGSGLAPMLQLLRAKARDPGCTVETCLFFANRKEIDILMREELQRLQSDGVLTRVWFTVDQAPEGWMYDKGYITEEMLSKQLFAPSDHTITLMCGRKAMTRGLVKPLLEKIGHDSSLIFKF